MPIEAFVVSDGRIRTPQTASQTLPHTFYDEARVHRARTAMLGENLPRSNVWYTPPRRFAQASRQAASSKRRATHPNSEKTYDWPSLRRRAATHHAILAHQHRSDSRPQRHTIARHIRVVCVLVHISCIPAQLLLKTMPRTTSIFTQCAVCVAVQQK